jgi:FkbM family methyltransferase
VGFYWIENRAEQLVKNYYSESDWRRNLVKELTSRKIDVVLDVGANSGQYATELRRSEFSGRIVSFEPLSGPFARLARSASADTLWDCRQCALGDVDGTISMNVAGNAGASSSILPMLKNHQDAFPQANYVGTEDVEIRRLDAVAPEVLRQGDAVFLKIDVQGFEKHVIAGGATTIDQRCGGIEIELSFAALYDGDMLIQEALDLVDSLGFVLAGLAPGFIDVRNGRVLQAEGVFFRAED